MKIGHKHYILLIMSILAFIVSATAYFIMYKNIVRQGSITSKAHAELQYQNEMKKHEEDLVKLYNNSEKDRQNINSIIISEDKIVDFIEAVESIGKQSGVEITISSINKENKDSKDTKLKNFNIGNTITARIDAKGSFSSIMKALVLLENMPYQVYLNNILLTTEATDNIGNGDINIPVKKKVNTNNKWSLSLQVKALSTK